jgi:hypothetical protein
VLGHNRMIVCLSMNTRAARAGITSSS